MELDIKGGTVEHEKKNYVSSSRSPNHGDTFHTEQEVTQSYEDNCLKNELATGGDLSILYHRSLRLFKPFLLVKKNWQK